MSENEDLEDRREELLASVDDAEIIGTVTDAMGDWVKVGVLESAVLIGVSGSPAILDTAEMHGKFARLWTEARGRATAGTPDGGIRAARSALEDATQAAMTDWRDCTMGSDCQHCESTRQAILSAAGRYADAVAVEFARTTREQS